MDKPREVLVLLRARAASCEMLFRRIQTCSVGHEARALQERDRGTNEEDWCTDRDGTWASSGGRTILFLGAAN